MLILVALFLLMGILQKMVLVALSLLMGILQKMVLVALSLLVGILQKCADTCSIVFAHGNITETHTQVPFQ